MVIYADVLVVTNMIVNYFLLLISAKLDHRDFGSFRIIVSSFLGGVFSLYILLEIDNTLIDILVKAICSAVMVITAFGYKSLKQFTRSSFYLLAASFIFAGVMLLISRLFGGDVILVNNSTVYYNVSVIGLILTSAALYLLITVILFFTHKRTIQAQICEISVEYGGNTAILKGFFDTGNSITDNFSDKVVVLADKNALINQNFSFEDDLFKKRYRVLPCKTVSGNAILEGFRADRITLKIAGKSCKFDAPLIMFSNTAIKEGYNALLNTDILSQVV